LDQELKGAAAKVPVIENGVGDGSKEVDILKSQSLSNVLFISELNGVASDN